MAMAKPPMGPPRLMRDDRAAELGVMAALPPVVEVATVELEAGAVEETITEVREADVEVLVTKLVVPVLVEVLLVVVVEVVEVEEPVVVEVEVPLAMEKSPVLAKTLVTLPMSTASSV